MKLKHTTYFTLRIKSVRRKFFGSILFRRAAGVETIISGSLTGHPCSQSFLFVRTSLQKINTQSQRERELHPSVIEVTPYKYRILYPEQNNKNN